MNHPLARRELRPEEELTQAGTHRPSDGACRFRRILRAGPPPEVFMSLQLGRLSPHDVLMAAGLRHGRDCRREAARGTTVGRLEAAGFRVRHDPLTLSPGHVAVYWGGEWDDDVGEKFERCFEWVEVGRG